MFKLDLGIVLGFSWFRTEVLFILSDNFSFENWKYSKNSFENVYSVWFVKLYDMS